jgi:F-type H+-transporting ATPase subunit a
VYAVNFFELIADALHLPVVVVGTWVVMAVLIVFGLIARSRLKSADDPMIPDEGVTVRSVSEALVEWFRGFVVEVAGHDALPLLPFFATLFIFILVANFFGLIPGMEPPTNDSDLTFALGAICFVFYLWRGFAAHGISYLKAFLGPVKFLIPLMMLIEIADNLFRPFSLGIRLFANMFADHTVLGIFTGFTYVGVPVALYALGSIVCIVQALVFTILAMTYVRMAQGEAH